MAVYKTPKNLTLGYSPSVKPTVPVEVDWSNPLSKHLRYLFINSNAVNPTGEKVTVTSNVYDKSGKIHFDGVIGNSIKVDNDKSWSLESYTIISKAFNESGDASYPAIWGKGDTGTGEAMLRLNGGNIQWYIQTFNLSSYVSFVNGASYACVYNHNGATNTDRYKFYENGIDLNISGYDALSLSTTKSFEIGNADSGIATNRYWKGDIEYVFVFNSNLSESEIKSLHENPYQLLKPQIETFYYTAGSGTTDNLLADDVESSSEVTSPAITQVHALTATSVQSTSEVTTATLTQVHALLANDIESASEVTTPTLTEGTHNLLANDVESNSELTTPTLAQIHNLLATSVQSLSQVSSPTLTQSGIHVLTAVSIESVSILSRPLLLTRTLTEGDIMAIANAVFDKFVAEGFDVNQINTLLTAIDSATSQLTYSVNNQLDVNIKSLNDTTLNGTGTSEDKWRG